MLGIRTSTPIEPRVSGMRSTNFPSESLGIMGIRTTYLWKIPSHVIINRSKVQGPGEPLGGKIESVLSAPAVLHSSTPALSQSQMYT